MSDKQLPISMFFFDMGVELGKEIAERRRVLLVGRKRRPSGSPNDRQGHYKRGRKFDGFLHSAERTGSLKRG